jgi:hypothetical protein
LVIGREVLHTSWYNNWFGLTISHTQWYNYLDVSHTS